MNIISQGHDPYLKGVYLCDCDCKGHSPTFKNEKVFVLKKEKKERKVA
jgi:hypothetical protein